MNPLRHKLFRDLRRLWIQAIAAGTVLGCGIAIFVMSIGTYASLESARDDYYQKSKMADLTTTLVRAPDSIAPFLALLPGVAAIETRTVGFGLIDLSTVDEPVTAQLLSLPDGRRPTVNDLVLRAGRWPETHRTNEALLNEAFATAHGIEPGGTISLLIRGERKRFNIVGVASSPEFVFAVAPGSILPEPGRFGVLWINRSTLASALELDGAFNDVVLRLSSEKSRATVSASIDERLTRYGNRGVYGRERMLSARFLTDELSQLKTLASILPPIFLLVATFLIHSILSRLVGMERSNIGLLKSFGYRNWAIGWHYAQFSIAFSLVGIGIGIFLGTIVGQYMTEVYRDVYHFPTLEFQADALTYSGAVTVGLIAGLLGAFSAVRQATRLAPIVALSPPTPTSFRKLSSGIERRLGNLSLRSRMVVRRLLQFPRRSAMTLIGIALALALLIMSEHFPIAINRLLELNFGTAQRMHATLTFADQRSDTVLRDIGRLPGVVMVEPIRAADVFFSSRHRREREAIIGLPQGAVLNRLVESNGSIVTPAKDGLTLSTSLARKLDVKAGDRILVKATDGKRVATEVTVSQVVSPFLGAGAHMDQTELGRMLHEPARISGAHLIIDAAQRQALNARLKQIPSIVGVAYTDHFQSELQKLFREGVGFFSNMFLFFSLSMAAGVAFSAARITISEQERDLATLRVLGYRRQAIASLPLGEMTALLIAAIPTGLLLGAALSNWMMHQFETDLFSFPLIFDQSTYAQSAIFITLAVLLATYWARRYMDRMHLVSALKSHE